MSILKQAGFAIAAASMTIGSTAAVAAPQPLRADVAIEDSAAMGEGAASGAWLGILAIAALVGIFLFAGKESGPTSP